jgi:PAS domain S-box-containing protein
MRAHPARRGPVISAIAAGAIGTTVLAGWAVDSMALKALAPGLGPVSPNAAVCITAAAIGLAIVAARLTAPPARYLMLSVVSVAVLLALLTLAEFAFGWNPGLDTLLVTGATDPGNPFPGRMIPGTAFCLALIAASILLVESTRTAALAQSLAALAGTWSLVSLGAVSLGFSPLAAGIQWAVSVQAALAILILAAGLLTLAPPFKILARLGRFATPVGFAISLIAVSAAGIGAYFNSRALAEVEAQLTRTQSALAHVAAIVTLASDAESASRGYVITGDDAFLSPLENAERALPSRIDGLRRALRDDPEQLAGVERLAGFTGSRMTLSRSNVTARRSGGLAAAQRAIADGTGRRVMDSVRAIAARLVATETAQLTERQASADARAAATQVGAFASAGLSITILLTIFGALRREVRERARAEADVKLLNRELESRVERRTEALHTSEFRLRSTLDGMMEGAQIVGFDRRYLYVNAVAARHGRTAAAELIGRTMSDCYPGIENTELYRLIGQCLTERTHHVLDNDFAYPDGSRAWFHLSIAPVEEGAFILSVDITERKLAEDALQKAEARQRALLRALPDQVLVVDASLTVREAHVPAQAHPSLLTGAVIGRAISDILPPDAAEAVARAVAMAEATRSPMQFEYSVTQQGTGRMYEAVAVAMDDSRTIIVSRDATERRTTEIQLRQSQKMEAVGQLTGGIAHDFNNLLTVIGSNAELVARTLPPGSEALDDITELRSAVTRGATMIAQLLKFSRQGMVARRTINLGDAFTGMTQMLRRLLPESVQLTATAEPDPLMVSADPGALEQIVMNLCTNARDAMPDGGSLRIAVHQTTIDRGYNATQPWIRPGTYACVEVTDSGTGMDEATRLRVFEPFFTTKSAGAGTGLGMAMVYGLMKEHDGLVNIYSELGKGTVVRLYFPIVTAPVESGGAQKDSALNARGGSETILLVEDDPAIRRASRRALEGRGYHVLDASDGEIALDILRNGGHNVSLVISDLVMPNLGGRQLAEAMRADGMEIPILIMSGYADTPTYRNADLPAGVEFLHKPWTLSDLFVKVRTLLDR